jgi:adenylate cyclase
MNLALPIDEKNGVDTRSVQLQLEKVLASPAFRASPRRREFLRYIVEQNAAGRIGNLKGYSIAVSVYGRAATFDPRLDPLIRIEAGRLRAELEAYYRTEGRNDAVIIDIPKGANVPRYSWRPSAITEDSESEPPEVMEIQPGPVIRHRRWMSAGIAGAIGALVLGFLVLSPSEVPLRSEAKLASVSVLPFEVENGDQSQSYFASGLSQELALRLFQFPALTVTPPSSMPPRQAGAEIPVRHSIGTKVFVEGSVFRGPDSVRVTARLVETASGQLLWAESFTRPVEAQGILEIQDEIASRIASNLGANMGVLARRALEEGAAARAPDSMSALDCVLRFHQHQARIEARSHALVRDCLEATTRREPAYASAWAALANVYGQEYRLGLNPRNAGKPAITRAQEAVEEALRLSPRNAQAMMARATLMFDTGDMAGFEQLAGEAIRLSPGEPDLAAHLGLRIATSGDWKRGGEWVRRAMAMNEKQYPAWYRIPLILAHYLEADYARALLLSGALPPTGFMDEDFFASMIH